MRLICKASILGPNKRHRQSKDDEDAFASCTTTTMMSVSFLNVRTPPLAAATRSRGPLREVVDEVPPPAMFCPNSCAQQVVHPTLQLTEPLASGNRLRTERIWPSERKKMNSSRREELRQTHGAAHRSPIQLARIITGVQRAYIARETHPRLTPPPTSPAQAHKLRHDRVRRARPRTGDAAPNAAAPTVFNVRAADADYAT